MTTTLHVTPQTIGLATAGAAALGLSIGEGLLQPLGTIERLATERQRSATTTTRSARRADQPTPEQAAELARQLAAAGTPAELADAAAAPIRLPGYDPTFTPDPENFGTI